MYSSAIKQKCALRVLTTRRRKGHGEGLIFFRFKEHLSYYMKITSETESTYRWHICMLQQQQLTLDKK